MILQSVPLASSDCQSLGGEAAAIEDHLLSRFRGRVQALRVQVQNEGLVLHGRARSFYVKQLAQHAVMEFTHVPILTNQIHVD